MASDHPDGARAGAGPLPLAEARARARERGGFCRVVSREDPRDVLLSAEGEGATLPGLPSGARVVVAEHRAGVLLRAFRPDLKCLRSATTVAALARYGAGEAEAAILPGSEVVRAGAESRISEWFHQTSWIPEPTRGFLAVVDPSEPEGGDEVLEAALRAEETVASALAGDVARSGGVVGAVAIPIGEGLRLWAMAVSADGRRAVRVHRTGARAEAERLGRSVLEILAARGVGSILEEAE